MIILVILGKLSTLIVAAVILLVLSQKLYAQSSRYPKSEVCVILMALNCIVIIFSCLIYLFIFSAFALKHN